MVKNLFISKFNKVHFIGIGGISTSALARYCLFNGVMVSGSDRSENEETTLLKSLGALVYVGHKNYLDDDVDAVIYTSAIDNDNKELLYAKEHNIKIYKRSEFLANVVKDFTYSLAVCGSHGKTTSTTMVGEIFIGYKKEPTVFVGGESNLFGNLNIGKKNLIIVEACEYKKNFLDIKSNSVIVTNIDNDHLDSYSSIDEEIGCFNKFIENTICYVNADDENSKNLHSETCITYGIENDAYYMAKNLKEENGSYSFSVYVGGVRLGRIKLKVKGKYNVYNALSALAFADQNKIPFHAIKSSLEGFSGVKRRNEYVGEFNNKKCYCDYAHHPSEIECYIKSLEREEVIIVFQPHTYSRTKFLMKDFVKVLSPVENLVIYKTYPAREEFDKDGDAKLLYKNIKKHNKSILYASNPSELKGAINGDNKAKKVCFIGAGDIYDIAVKKIIKN